MVSESVLDVLVVGAGLHTLYKLRKCGFRVKVYEAGSGVGGVWFWNRYPGCRVDTEWSIYQLTQDEVWKDFEWNERFPDHYKMKEYFSYLDKKRNLSADIKFNTKVVSAEFNKTRKQWLVKSSSSSENEQRTWASHIVLCTGSSSTTYTPSFPGLDKYKGKWYHTGLWPKSGVDLEGKRVAVVGTGASGVQVIQEIGTTVDHLTVYQRTPNLAIPMQQCTAKDQSTWKCPKENEFNEIFKKLRTTFGGNVTDFINLSGVEATPEERCIAFEKLFQRGGFEFWVGNYKDIFFNQETNDLAYQFWCEKTRARINDPIKRDILAPRIPPHPFGTKRPSLEQRYYEVYNQDNVGIIDVRQSPIIEITETGIRTQKEGVTDLDIIIFATGFDAYTGAIRDIQITNDEGTSLRDKWEYSTWTHLGMATADFPNLFFVYGPQAPTAFSNGPTCSEIQGDWIVNLLIHMSKNNKAIAVATEEAEANWKEIVNGIWNASLFPKADSWYQGANIPGKPKQAYNYPGGIPAYISAIDTCAKNNYKGFIFS